MSNILLKEEHEELFYQLALTFVPGIGAKTGRVLLEHFGSAAVIFKTPLKELKHIDGIGEVKVKGFKDPEVMVMAERELNFILKKDITVFYHKHNYPTRLSNCSDAPLVLFYKGNAELEVTKVIAIVGTRKNTDYGHKLCEELVEGLQSLSNVLVVSGLALGIDAIAHKKCVSLGIPTVGVLGHGLDRIYPYNHKELSEQMIENGGILAEFPSETLPDRNNFPMRNRMLTLLMYVSLLNVCFSFSAYLDV